ncbi:MAG TPA: hypothetical protein PK760_09065, partial [Flavobacteriales bacterium]|nr:hypothetical protein [Flavobacteriales bacterium]
MRTLILFCAFVLVGQMHAQNWALINPAYKYNYSNDGTDTICNQIRVMAVNTIGTDSSLCALNPIGLACAPCNGIPAGCATNAGLFADRPQVFGASAIVSVSQWTLIGDDTLLVQADAMLGAIWMGPGGVQGTVSSVTEEDLFGQLDSVKQIDFSNGATMRISKSHGVTAFAANGEAYALIGVQGGIE